MTPRPQSIDGARVLQVANLDEAVPTGATRHVVRGEEVQDFAWIAIARYEEEPGVYLFYCGADWEPITDTFHESLEDAVAQAEFEFGPLEFEDVQAGRGRPVE